MEPFARFAVVGAKGYSLSHLQCVSVLTERQRGKLVASTMVDRCDHPDLVTQFEAQGINVFDSYEEMLTACHGLVDVVTLPVPIHLHARMSIAALSAGYHVMVEKPVAASVDQVGEMTAARDASRRQCAVGYQQIYSSVVQALKRYIVEGRLGPVHEIRTMALWPRKPTYYSRNDWAGKLYQDGQPVFDSPFNNALAHQVMNMLYLASPSPGHAAHPAHVEAELFRAYDIESFDTGCMRVLTDSDVRLVFAASHACGTMFGPTMQLVAEDAVVHWEPESDATVDYGGGRTETLKSDDCRIAMFENIVDAVSGVVPEPLCTLEIARAQVACIQAIHRAARIAAVSRPLVSEHADGQRVIAGIEQAVRQVFTTGQLFSEIGVSFS